MSRVKRLYKPCVSTIEQAEKSKKRNGEVVVVMMTLS